jgi:hypothetical protein
MAGTPVIAVGLNGYARIAMAYCYLHWNVTGSAGVKLICRCWPRAGACRVQPPRGDV